MTVEGIEISWELRERLTGRQTNLKGRQDFSHSLDDKPCRQHLIPAVKLFPPCLLSGDLRILPPSAFHSPAAPAEENQKIYREFSRMNADKGIIPSFNP
jgi:hypothetical protein